LNGSAEGFWDDKNKNKNKKGGYMPKQIIVKNASRAQKIKVNFR
jgi:hypothetical protein